MMSIPDMVALGLREHQAGQLDRAEQLYRQILQVNPSHADALHLMGVLISQRGRDDLAIPYIERALIVKPHVAAFHNNLGFSYQGLGRLDDAEASFRRAIQLQPDFAMAYNNLGNVFRAQGNGVAAAEYYRTAIQLQPDYPEPHGNLGVVLQEQGKYEEALPCYEESLRFKPDHAETHVNRAMLWLALGDCERGWPEFEWRWRTKDLPGYGFKQARWDGAPLNGRTLLLYGEQGLGDTIQFIRYVKLVRQQDRVSKKLIVQCQVPLVRLLRGFPGIDQIAGRGAPLPDFDVHAPLLSLPGIFHTNLASIPADIPYLHADAKLMRQWKRTLCDESAKSEHSSTPHSAPCTRHFLVGICWQGNADKPFDFHRSMALAHFAPLAAVPGVKLISLQKGQGSEQLAQAAKQFPIMDLGDKFDESAGPFMDSAAAIKNLDLLITSDTAVPHLAGALGVPIWVAVPLAADWRWLIQREDSPWYPTMRLFRQTRYGHWEDVFQRIAEELAVVSKQQ
jgi:Tfp pilus assembly protein PilF